jgi:uncharacterized protein (TIGR03000 family)
MKSNEGGHVKEEGRLARSSSSPTLKETSVHRILLGLTVGLLVLAIPSAAQAQRGGGGRGGSGGGHAAPAGRGGSGGHVAPGVSGGRGGSTYNRGYYNPGYYGRPYFYGGYYGGVGIYLGDPYSYGSGYYGYPDSYLPPAGPADYPPSYLRPMPPPADSPNGPEPARLATIANIRVILPNAEAKLLVDGNATTSTGATRLLETPELKPGATYHYELTVTWDEGARTITEKRRIDVTPGAVTTADFTRPAQRPQP